MKTGISAVLIILLTIVLVGCDLAPSDDGNGWSTITISVLGTAYSDVDITVQTDVEGIFVDTVAPASLPWNYYQFSFENDYSVQVSTTSVPRTTSTTTADSISIGAGGQTLYQVTDSSASFSVDADSQDVIFNDDSAGASARVCCVIDNQNLYIYEDSSGQNIFDPASYTAPVAYTIYRSHELWLMTIITDSENNQSKSTYHQKNYIIDIQTTN